MYSFRASELPRIAKCPGSYNAKPKTIDPGSSPIAASGQRIHLALEKTATAALESYKQGESFEAAMLAHVESIAMLYTTGEREAFVARWFAGIVGKIADSHGGLVSLEVERAFEMRLGEYWGELTGHVDLILHCKDRSRHVIDYKTGYGAVETSEDNKQGQGYAVLMFHAEPDRVKMSGGLYVHFIAAGNEKEERHTYTHYDIETLPRLTGAIEGLLWGACQEDTQRKVGVDQCQYCPAACTLACPESMKALYMFGDGRIDRKQDVGTTLADMTPQVRAAMVDEALLVARLAKKVCDAAKGMLTADPDSVEGYMLGKGRTSKDVGPVRDVFEMLQPAFGLPEIEFLGCCKPSLPKIIEACTASEQAKAAAEGGPKPTKKATADLVVACLHSLITEKTATGSLKRIDPDAEGKDRPKLIDTVSAM